jgi:hypothetical protein
MRFSLFELRESSVKKGEPCQFEHCAQVAAISEDVDG